MTPERKEEIRAFIATLDPGCELASWLNSLLDALEETEQQLSNKERSLEKFKVLASDNHTLAAKYERELAEAQQTIALKQSSIETLTGQVVDETALHAKTAAKLIVAEQTIARLTSETVNKQKLLEWLDIEIDLSSGNDPVLKADRWAFRQTKKEIESGRLNAAIGEGAKES